MSNDVKRYVMHEIVKGRYDIEYVLARDHDAAMAKQKAYALEIIDAGTKELARQLIVMNSQAKTIAARDRRIEELEADLQRTRSLFAERCDSLAEARKEIAELQAAGKRHEFTKKLNIKREAELVTARAVNAKLKDTFARVETEFSLGGLSHEVWTIDLLKQTAEEIAAIEKGTTT